MYCLTNTCFMCFKDVESIKSLRLFKVKDSTSKQINFVLPEIMLEPNSHVYICSACHRKVRNFCTFKTVCLDNYGRMKHFPKYLQGSNSAKNQLFNTDVQINNNLTDDVPVAQNDQTHFINETNTNTKEDIDFEEQLLTYHITQEQQKQLNYDLTSEEMEEQNDLMNEDNFNITFETIDYKDIEEHNLHHLLLSDIKKENENEQVTEDIEMYQDETVSTAAIDHEHENTEVCKNNTDSTIDMTNHGKNCMCSACNQIDFDILDRIEMCNNFNQNMKEIKDFVKCNICNKILRQRCDIRNHWKEHADIKDFKCSVCNQQFYNKASMEKHEEIHTRNKDLTCYVCNRKFSARSHHKMHMKTHSDFKEYECSICDKQFKFRNSFKKHMNLHAGIYNYECTICNKKFILCGNYKLHMKRHTEIKDKQCPFCHNQYTDHSNMLTHMRVHHGH